ncbi:hypothetical protein H4R18_003777 [Coemansia javaensis]|uniref:Uncharacterized protein n=1 Tax=Coemansia javaensis TaxID=2761396 RepID=A0A9W8H620_9FUNG|nr:hypothetical protein H4R18_003777 [Coemansia javaensis]
MNNISPHEVAAARILATALAAVGLALALVTLALWVVLCRRRQDIACVTIVRAILLLQILEGARCVFELVTIHVGSAADGGCRAIVFFALVTTAAPLNLSVVCMLYLQAVLLHQAQLHRRRLRVALLAAVAGYTLVPAMFVLFIPARTAGMASFCDFYDAPSRRLFVFKWLVSYIWITLTCIAGLYSIVAMVASIVHRSQKVRRRLCSTSSAELDTPGGSISSELNATVVKESLQRRRQSSGQIVAKTLRAMVWFSVVPVVCLGFNTVYSIVWYRTQQQPLAVFIVDRVLQFLAVPLYSLSFYLNPSIRRALGSHLCGWRDPEARFSAATQHTLCSQQAFYSMSAPGQAIETRSTVRSSPRSPESSASSHSTHSKAASTGASDASDSTASVETDDATEAAGQQRR